MTCVHIHVQGTKGCMHAFVHAGMQWKLGCKTRTYQARGLVIELSVRISIATVRVARKFGPGHSLPVSIRLR